MQRNPIRNKFRTTLLAACVALAFVGAAHAQTVPSPETDPVKGRAPTLATATITGTPSGAGGAWVAGDVLTAVYTVADEDNDTPDYSASDLTIQWTSGGAAVGTLGSKTYTLQASDAGKTITYRLVPHTDPAITDPYQGIATIADTVGADGTGGTGGGEENGGDGGEIDVTPADALLSVSITGSATVSTALTAVPSCATACGGTITYQWQLETAAGSGTFANIAGATTNTYTPVRQDQKRRVKVIATKP